VVPTSFDTNMEMKGLSYISKLSPHLDAC
jgi:hypothetical protein